MKDAVLSLLGATVGILMLVTALPTAAAPLEPSSKWAGAALPADAAVPGVFIVRICGAPAIYVAWRAGEIRFVEVPHDFVDYTTRRWVLEIMEDVQAAGRPHWEAALDEETVKFITCKGRKK